MALKKIAVEYRETRPTADEDRQGGREVAEFTYQVKGLDAATLAQKIREKFEGHNISSIDLTTNLSSLVDILKVILFEEHSVRAGVDLVVNSNPDNPAEGTVYTVSEPLLKYLRELDVPRSKWQVAAEAVERLVRDFSGPLDRPRWEDRAKYSELEFLPAPAFLKRVWADKISPTGEIEKELVRRQDPALMVAVEGYVKNRQRRAVDVGAAEGLKLISRGYGGRKPSKKSR